MRGSMKRYLSLFLCLLVIWNTGVGAAFAEQITYYHTDAAGTPLAISDAAGQRVWEADYKPFGEEFSTSGSAVNDRRFVGKEKDEETGLNYFGARYLSAGTGRFLAPDPVRAVDGYTGRINESLLLEPQRQNTYAYSLNNPYRYSDPDGEFAAPLVLAAVGLTALTVGGGANHIARQYEGMVSSAQGLVDRANSVWNAFAETNEGQDAHDGDTSNNGEQAHFPNDTELAKKLGVKPKQIHPVKEEIKKDHPKELKKLNSTNPDLGYERDGSLVLKNPKTGQTIKTDNNIKNYKRD